MENLDFPPLYLISSAAAKSAAFLPQIAAIFCCHCMLQHSLEAFYFNIHLLIYCCCFSLSHNIRTHKGRGRSTHLETERKQGSPFVICHSKRACRSRLPNCVSTST